MLPHFEEITFEHFPREENQLEDALATMSSMFRVNCDNEAPQIIIERLDEPTHCCDIETEEVTEKPWYHFFQAEDGIRDIGVTGVQTCALPIYPAPDSSVFHPQYN